MSDTYTAIQIIERIITNKSSELIKGREELKEMYHRLLTITENLNELIGNLDSEWDENDSR